MQGTARTRPAGASLSTLRAAALTEGTPAVSSLGTPAVSSLCPPVMAIAAQTSTLWALALWRGRVVAHLGVERVQAALRVRGVVDRVLGVEVHAPPGLAVAGFLLHIL